MSKRSRTPISHIRHEENIGRLREPCNRWHYTTPVMPSTIQQSTTPAHRFLKQIAFVAAVGMSSLCSSHQVLRRLGGAFQQRRGIVTIILPSEVVVASSTDGWMSTSSESSSVLRTHQAFVCSANGLRRHGGGPWRRRRSQEVHSSLKMASELSKTAIHTMRVNELRRELESRGLQATGTRPVLQARLGEAAAATERARNQPVQSRQTGGDNRRSDANGPAEKVARRGAHTLVAPAELAEPAGPAESLATLQLLPEDADTGEADSTTAANRDARRGTTASRSTGREAPASTPGGRLSHLEGSSTSAEYVMQFDGGSRGNPGPSGAGAVLYRLDDESQRHEVFSVSVWVGNDATNNEAEYCGLLEGLRAAKELGIKRLSVEGDSTLVIQQMLGNFKVNSPKMRPKFEEAKRLAAHFDELNLEHIARTLNGRADTLANVAMDSRATTRFTQPSFAHFVGESQPQDHSEWMQDPSYKPLYIIAKGYS